jgi:hypothetical protein
MSESTTVISVRNNIGWLNAKFFIEDESAREQFRKSYKIKVLKPQSLRDIGAILRETVKGLWYSCEVVQLDFGNATVASGSIFDELAKLFDEYPKEEVKRRLKFVNIDEWDQNLFLHLAKMRLEDKAKKVALPA